MLVPAPFIIIRKNLANLFIDSTDAGKPRAETAEKLDKWIDDHGGTPEPPGGYGPVNGGGAGLAVLDQKLEQS